MLDNKKGYQAKKNNQQQDINSILLPHSHCIRLQRQIEVIAQEMEYINDPRKFEHSAIVITHILQSFALITDEFGLTQLNHHRVLMAIMVNEWLATLHLPNEEELSTFKKHLGNISLLVKALLAQDTEKKGVVSLLRNKMINKPDLFNGKVVGSIQPDERLGQYRLMVSTSQDMLAMIDSEYRYVIVNPAYNKMFSNHSKDITGLTVPEVIGNDNFLDKVKPNIDRALSGLSVRFEVSIPNKEMEMVHLDVCYEPYKNLQDKVTGMVVSARNITARKNMEYALEHSEQRFRTLCDLSPTGIFRNNAAGEAVYVNPRTAACIGVEQQQCLQNGWSSQLHPDDREYIFSAWNKAVLQHDSFDQEYRFLHKNGDEVWVSCSAVPELNSQGECTGYIGTLVDITQQKQGEENSKLAASVFENTQDGIIITDKNVKIISVNPAFEKITGYSKQEALGKNPRFLHSGIQDQDFYEKMWKEIDKVGFWRGELWNRRKDGSAFPQWLSISVVKNNDNDVLSYVSVFSDISAIKKSEERLTWLAYHDPLTNLANRLLFTERLEHGIARANRDETLLAVIFLDFDNFKHINDSMGHKAGDELLIGVAARLKEILRTNDTLSRFGGDEFTILIENYRSLNEINAITRKISESFKTPFSICGKTIYISISMGISVYPTDGDKAEALLRNADSAMYRAKKQGGGCRRFYTYELTETAQRRIDVESGIRNAIKNNELRLIFQPQFEAKNGQLIGAEALLRWHSSSMGEVSPGIFIPIAEESPIIIELGGWVLENACLQAKKWLDKYQINFRMGVNISVRQIKKDEFIQQVVEVLKKTTLSPHNLELEVTEGVVMNRAETERLQKLREMGIKISIDDFGTGFSSLSYLRDLPVDRLKIDQSFVRDIGHNKRDEAIVRAIIAMGHAHGLEIIAEGVEESEQKEFLRYEGCDELQGFLMGRPMPAENFVKLLE